MTTTETLLDCGHLPTADSGIGTGYAVRLDDTKICYACADAAQVAEVEDSATTLFLGYVTENTITTWTGGVLGWVVRRMEGERRYSSLGMPMRWVSYDVGTYDGRRWYGRHNIESGDALVLRVRKSSR